MTQARDLALDRREGCLVESPLVLLLLHSRHELLVAHGSLLLLSVTRAIAVSDAPVVHATQMTRHVERDVQFAVISSLVAVVGQVARGTYLFGLLVPHKHLLHKALEHLQLQQLSFGDEVV